MIRTLTKRVLERLARWVAKNELFEKPGDRAPQAPLPPDAWSGSEAQPSERENGA